MEKVKTLLYLRSEEQNLFDGSVKGNFVKKIGDVKTTPLENEFLFNKGGLQIGRIPELERSGAFTLEALITPEVVVGKRQNIMEAQSPPVAFFIDDKGFLNGTVNTQQGWQGVKSNAPLQAGISQKVRFSRDNTGTMYLEVNEKNVAKKMIPGGLAAVGQEGFRVGTWIDGSTYQFKGKIANVQVRSGGFTTEFWNKRIQNAKTIEQALKNKIQINIPITVFPGLDEAQQRLQKVKEIMQSAGVDKISDLATLQIKVPTVIPKGKILIAPRKGGFVIDWKNIAGTYRTLTPEGKKQQLAKYLTNRNSITLLKNSKTESPTLRGNGHATQPGREAAGAVTALNRNFTTAIRLHDIIKDKPELTLINKDAVINKIKGDAPGGWPQLNFTTTALRSLTIGVNTSVIIAGVLDLTNTELIIAPDVERLYIIAEQVICGPNAKITWQRPGGATPPRLDNPDLNGRGWSGVQTKPDSRDGLDGENGRSGEGGINGATGRNAPSLEMWVRNLTNVPTIDLNGEDGITGGKGQNGGRGGNGADGHAGERYWLFGWHCSTDPGDGGDGGNGGRGGDGGRGGNGGTAGQIVIGVLDGTLAATVTAGQFHWKNQGGQKGRGGPGGNGGGGGFGGRSGNGETCHDGRNGHNGSQGQPGSMGADANRLGQDGSDLFFEFSEDDWDELLTRPFITEISPVDVFPGNAITIRGSRFTNNDTVVVGSLSLNPVVNPDESISVTIPASISGGTKSVFVRRASDNTESNHIPIQVKPQLDVLPASLPPAVQITVTGKAFLPNASVLIDGLAIPANVIGPTQLKFTMPGTGGTGSTGGSVLVQVRNPDGLVSNSRMASKPRVLEIPFRFGQHNLTIGNPNDGIPSWGTYEQTFGAAEVWHEQLDPVFGHPVLTAAYYGFYNYFLKGEGNGGLATGFCTSLASLVADKLWKGENDAVTITKPAVHEWLTAVHGKLLSRESLIHFHDQSRQEVANVEATARFIEHAFLTGVDRNTAPLLFFIPSGAIWDSGYIDGLGSSHCIMPYRFVYPDNHPGPQLSADGSTTITDLDGVELFCWDCNHDTNDNCRVIFRKENGVIHFSYKDGGDAIQFDSTNKITLGNWNNGSYLLADHDLPFSGPFGLTSFIIDFLLSPADLAITDEDGLRVGNFNNKIYSEMPDSHPCYLAKGAYLLPVGRNLTRNIIGNGNGSYTFSSIMPDGTTIRLENVQTAPGHKDVLSVNADASQLRFAPHQEKEFTVTFSKLVNGEVRSLALGGVGGGPATEIDITVAPDLSLFRLGNRSGLKNVKVQAFGLNRTDNVPVNKSANVALPSNHDLVVSVTDWKTVNLNAEALPF